MCGSVQIGVATPTCKGCEEEEEFQVSLVTAAHFEGPIKFSHWVFAQPTALAGFAKATRVCRGDPGTTPNPAVTKKTGPAFGGLLREIAPLRTNSRDMGHPQT